MYVPARFPSRARRPTNGWPTRSSRSATSRAAVRSSSRLSYALDALVERASPRRPSPCRPGAPRRASASESASATTSTRFCSPRPRSGRASTCRASPLAPRRRQAPLRRPWRSARRGTLRAHRPRRRGLVQRVRAAISDPPAAPGFGRSSGVTRTRRRDPRLQAPLALVRKPLSKPFRPPRCGRPRRRSRVLRHRSAGDCLIPFGLVAKKKKSRVPAPPRPVQASERRVQAPQKRVDHGGGTARACGFSWSAGRSCSRRSSLECSSFWRR